jgi:uncharacterized SAM-dependent methyltransferase
MKPRGPRSQLLDLTFHVAELFGATTDREIAELVDVSPENVANWRAGTVQELKVGTLEALKSGLTVRMATLREQVRVLEAGIQQGLIPLEIEEGSGPDALQRQFADRVSYDYVGHSFLYFDPLGALAWESLIKSGYEQSCWLRGVERCLAEWLDAPASGGEAKGPLAAGLGLGRRGALRGLDVVSLGPGEGSKEIIIARALATLERPLPWLTLAMVDVSIPLLFKAGKGLRRALEGTTGRHTVLPFCADFENGPLGFRHRLPTAIRDEPPGLRLVLLLGNVFGNLRDEEAFVRERLSMLTRPGDLLWLEVGLRLEKIEQDPVYPMTIADHAATPAETNRCLLLEGPYRRWLAATGRRSAAVETRVWIREGDEASRVPGSLNFCHDLVLEEEHRTCTMLYSRRYDLPGLTRWFSERGYEALRIGRTEDTAERQRVAHVLLRRK